MKKLLLTSVVIAGALSMSSCATYQPQGAIYNDATMAVAANPGVQATKTGKACANSYVGLIATGDASVETAMKNAGITKVATMNQHTNNILGVYGEYCTVVTGQ